MDLGRTRGDKPGPNMAKEMSSKVILIWSNTRRAVIIGSGNRSDDTHDDTIPTDWNQH